MAHRQVANATERIVAKIIPQAQAIYPRASSSTIKSEMEKCVHDAFREARRLHPRSVPRQTAHAQKRADEAIKMNLATFRGTRH